MIRRVVALALNLLCGDTRVVTAETKRVAYDSSHFRLARRVWDIIQVALRIGYLVVDRGREHVRFERFGANGHLDSSGSSEHVAGGPFGRADGHFARVLAKNCLDGLCLGDISLRSGCPVGVDI